MNILTKLFVVLLTLTSIILAAGVLTFVNRVAPLQAALKSSQQQYQIAESGRQGLLAALAAKDLQLQSKTKDVDAAVAQAASTVAALGKDIDAKDASLAANTAKIASLEAQLASANASVKAMADQQAVIQNLLVDARKSLDDSQLKLTSSEKLGADQAARIEVLTKQYNFATEQLSDAKSRLDKVSLMAKEAGVNVASVDTYQTTASPTGVNGIIRSRRTINGREYATISIGTRDRVAKGMKFNIMDKASGKFLGQVTIDVVDENESMGHIDADNGNLSSIGAGNEVRSTAI